MMGISDCPTRDVGILIVMTTDDIAADGDASEQVAMPASPEVSAPPAVSADTIALAAASDDILTALADNLAYTLTAGQALERYAAAQRKVPSLRTIQRYCDEGRLTAQKIRTTYGSEWLINETSLAKLIETEPVVASVAVSLSVATTAAPIAAPSVHVQHDTSANSVAGDAEPQELAAPVGERRRLADVLIENSRLVAQSDGKDALIAELKEDRDFLREEVREGRRNRDDVKNIAQQMLDTLKTMALGRLTAPTAPAEPVHADVIRNEARQG